MPLTVQQYDLPDAFLFDGKGDGYLVWQPDRYYIVLGMSNNPEGSLFIGNVIKDCIPVIKRQTGGEAVMLTPLNVAITVAKEFHSVIPFKKFFKTVNGLIIESLEEIGICGLGSKGISDITIGNRKILGSSMRCKGSRLVYHAVFNVSEDPGLFEKYLRHPKREPDYRSGRSHIEFVTSLKNEGYNTSSKELISLMSNRIKEFLNHQQ
jgi:lipoate---protein ligase